MNIYDRLSVGLIKKRTVIAATYEAQCDILSTPCLYTITQLCTRNNLHMLFTVTTRKLFQHKQNKFGKNGQKNMDWVS